MTDRLVPVEEPGDVTEPYRGTPVGRLLAYHNLGAAPDAYDRAELLVGTCMDHRVRLRMPERFAYVLRTGGGNLRGHDFEVSFAVAVGGVGAVALIGHSDCGMARVTGEEEAFVQGLEAAAGWDPEAAEAHFRDQAPGHEIGDPVEFTVSEAERLRRTYPEVLVAPLHYRVDDGRIYLIRE